MEEAVGYTVAQRGRVLRYGIDGEVLAVATAIATPYGHDDEGEDEEEDERDDGGDDERLIAARGVLVAGA